MGCCLSKRKVAKTPIKGAELSSVNSAIHHDPDEEFDDGFDFVPLNAMKDAKIRFDDDGGDSDDEYEPEEKEADILESKVDENYKSGNGSGEGDGGTGSGDGGDGSGTGTGGAGDGSGTGGDGDGTGINGHAASVAYADETLELLKSQLKSKGIVPLEFIPLADIKAEVASLMEQANKGEPFDDARLDYLLACMELNPEYQKEKEEEAQRWRDEIGPYSRECLQTMRAFIPPSIFSCSVDSLISDFNFSRELAKRLMTKKCLWLIRILKSDIERIHEAELMGRFNPESQGLDIVETAAIYAAIPQKFNKDATGRKEAWRLSLEKNLKDMYKQHKAGTLLKIKKRSLAYNNQVPQFTARETLHEMRSVSSDGANAPRSSFLTLNKGGSSATGSGQSVNSIQQKRTVSTASETSTASKESEGNAAAPARTDKHAALVMGLNGALNKRIPVQETASASSRI